MKLRRWIRGHFARCATSGFLGALKARVYLREIPVSKHGGKVSRLLLNVLFVKFPVGQVLSPLLLVGRERRKRESNSDRADGGCLQESGRMG